jgi:hypothetical protein
MMVNELHRSEKCGWRQFGVAASQMPATRLPTRFVECVEVRLLMNDGNKQKLMWVSRCQIE